MNTQTIVSSPLRLSLLGGGTDIPHIINKLNRGKTISASINLYVTVGCTSLPFFRGIKLKYSTTEIVDDIDSIIHPIFKEVLNYFNYNLDNYPGLEIFSTASIPSGNGLGSSAAFTSSLVQCIAKHLKNEVYSKEKLLELASSIERNSGNKNIGFQDQISSIWGSFASTVYKPDKIEVKYPSKEWERGMRDLIEKRGFLLKTESRTGLSSNFIEAHFLEKNIEVYEQILNLAEELDITDSTFNEQKVIELLVESSKISKATKVRTRLVEELETSLKDAGAIYTKQLGAGGGGFIFCLFEKEPDKIPPNLKKLMLKPKISNGGLRIL
ncbi:hypothetical protein [uncultured Prochlorococcus sp.]|uniref:GHMP family kinase ATP-binding protein n=1 Tax=uncultured Prochlorococcus sp. TaxID=159733 RepID=UPI0025901958|nr:hypothetical protein [uncultured Prochlorococcus sp.]